MSKVSFLNKKKHTMTMMTMMNTNRHVVDTGNMEFLLCAIILEFGTFVPINVALLLLVCLLLVWRIKSKECSV